MKVVAKPLLRLLRRQPPPGPPKPPPGPPKAPPEPSDGLLSDGLPTTERGGGGESLGAILGTQNRPRNGTAPDWYFEKRVFETRRKKSKKRAKKERKKGPRDPQEKVGG